MTASEKTEYDQRVADLRAAMDAQDFADAWARGRAMGMDQAIAYALASPARAASESSGPTSTAPRATSATSA